MIHNPLIHNNSDWARPIDWLPIDHLVDTSSEKAVMLFAVYDDEMNAIAINKAKGTIIDWGDGSVTNNDAGRSEHIYTYSSIPDNTLCNRGYKQVIITMYNDIGYHILSINFQRPLTLIVMPPQYPVRILDIKLHTPYITSYTSGGSSYCVMSMCEKVNWIGTTGFTLPIIVFWKMYRLQWFYMEDYTKISHTQEAVLLKPEYIDDTFTNMKMQDKFTYHVQYLKEFVNLTESNITSLSRSFYWAVNTDKIEINCKNITDSTNMVAYAHNLRELILTNCDNITTTTIMFTYNYNITKLILQGLKVSISCHQMSLSANAIDNLFTSLGTASISPIQYINVSGNPGTASCNTSIATNKNWVVVL